MDFRAPSKIVVTCSKLLSSYLSREVSELGFEAKTFATGVELRGTLADCVSIALRARTASQVLFSLGMFKAQNPDELYTSLLNYPWEQVVSPDGYFSVTSNVDHPTIDNSLFVNVKVKDAIVDRISRAKGKRPDSGSSLQGVVIHAYWKSNYAEIFLDAAGETLAKHGYRKIPGSAPMLESLAAATLLATQWDMHVPLVNPMCGSGTIAIEAALLATNRRPGLFRNNYSFMHVVGYEPAVYETTLRQLREGIQPAPDLSIIASDIDAEAVTNARVNARAAGVDKLIQFKVCDFTETPVPPGNGIVFINPEYGSRLGAIDQLAAVYAGIGDFLKKKCGGYTGYVFTGNMDLAKKIGLRANKKIPFYSAKLDCRLLEYELYAGSRREPNKGREASS